MTACVHVLMVVSGCKLICDRIWENPPYWTRAQISLRAVIVTMVTDHHNPTLSINEYAYLCSAWCTSYTPQLPFLRRVEAQTPR